MITNSEKKRIQYARKPNKIQALRIKKDITQIEVATDLGLSRIYYGNIEKGLRTANEKLAKRIAELLGVKLSEIFKVNGDKKYIVKS